MAESHLNSQEWRITGGRLLRPAPFLVAGIVNITPDSFSDGGDFLEPDAAMGRVRQILAEGADMVDLGAESTRPGAEDIGHVEEWRRLAPVLEETLALRESLQRKAGDAPERPGGLSSGSFTVAIDTFRAETAAKALYFFGSEQPGGPVDVINDISGAAFDPAMADVLASFKPGYVLGHSPAPPLEMQADPQYDDVVEELLSWFTSRMDHLVKAGLPEECIALDPCIGFGKNTAHNLAIIAAIPRFAALGRPLYFGISRKSFIGAVTGEAARKRDSSTQVVTAWLAHAGVAVHRVHQVAETVATLKIVRALSTQGLEDTAALA